jgi:hypothetical protein
MTCRRVEQFSQRASRGGCDLSQAANIARRRALRFETNRSTRSAGCGLLGNAWGGHQSLFDGRLILKARIR